MEMSVAEKFAKSLCFEVQAIPQSNGADKANSSENMTPFNVKIRIRKREELSDLQLGVYAMPKHGTPDRMPERLRLASSDQTIMSFNMLMENELEKKAHKKSRKPFFSACFGTQVDDDDDAYMPCTSEKDSRSDSGMLKKQKLSKNVNYDNISNTSNITRKETIFFGKCKPGGCLDPPFGEDRYVYRPTSVIYNQPVPATKVDELERQKLEKDSKSTRSNISEDMLNENQDIKKDRKSNLKTKNKVIDSDISSEHLSSVTDIEVTDEREKSKLDIPSRVKPSKEETSDKNYTIALDKNDLITTRAAVYQEKRELVKNNSSNDNIRNSFNEFSTTYFNPPKRDKRNSSSSKDRDPIKNNNKLSSSPKNEIMGNEQLKKASISSGDGIFTPKNVESINSIPSDFMLPGIDAAFKDYVNSKKQRKSSEIQRETEQNDIQESLMQTNENPDKKKEHKSPLQSIEKKKLHDSPLQTSETQEKDQQSILQSSQTPAQKEQESPSQTRAEKIQHESALEINETPKNGHESNLECTENEFALQSSDISKKKEHKSPFQSIEKKKLHDSPLQTSETQEKDQQSILQSSQTPAQKEQESPSQTRAEKIQHESALEINETPKNGHESNLECTENEFALQSSDISKKKEHKSPLQSIEKKKLHDSHLQTSETQEKDQQSILQSSQTPEQKEQESPSQTSAQKIQNESALETNETPKNGHESNLESTENEFALQSSDISKKKEQESSFQAIETPKKTKQESPLQIGESPVQTSELLLQTSETTFQTSNEIEKKKIYLKSDAKSDDSDIKPQHKFNLSHDNVLNHPNAVESPVKTSPDPDLDVDDIINVNYNTELDSTPLQQRIQRTPIERERISSDVLRKSQFTSFDKPSLRDIESSKDILRKSNARDGANLQSPEDHKYETYEKVQTYENFTRPDVNLPLPDDEKTVKPSETSLPKYDDGMVGKINYPNNDSFSPNNVQKNQDNSLEPKSSTLNTEKNQENFYYTVTKVPYDPVKESLTVPNLESEPQRNLDERNKPLNEDAIPSNKTLIEEIQRNLDETNTQLLENDTLSTKTQEFQTIYEKIKPVDIDNFFSTETQIETQDNFIENKVDGTKNTDKDSLLKKQSQEYVDKNETNNITRDSKENIFLEKAREENKEILHNKIDPSEKVSMSESNAPTDLLQENYQTDSDSRLPHSENINTKVDEGARGEKRMTHNKGTKTDLDSGSFLDRNSLSKSPVTQIHIPPEEVEKKSSVSTDLSSHFILDDSEKDNISTKDILSVFQENVDSLVATTGDSESLSNKGTQVPAKYLEEGEAVQEYKEETPSENNELHQNISSEIYEIEKNTKLQDKTSADGQGHEKHYEYEINLDLAFQSYTNAYNKRFLKSLDVMENPPKHIIQLKTLLRPNKEVRIPIDAEYQMSVQITKAIKTNSENKKPFGSVRSVQFDKEENYAVNYLHDNDFKPSEFTIKKLGSELHETLSTIYEHELVPLQNIIKALKEDIDQLTEQQILYRDKIHTKRSRVTHSTKKCICIKKFV